MCELTNTMFSGHSVCCQVHGFEPYFYISCPSGMGPDDISRFKQILEVSSILF
jgi:DNA polymerase delta subunit 1